jgi:hypothetical protein
MLINCNFGFWILADKDSGLLGCSLAAAESTTDPEFIHIVEVVKYLVDNVIESVRLNQLAPVRTYHIVCDEDDDSCSSLDTGLRYTEYIEIN